LAHELDAAWIIALWLAIHDGDPPPETNQAIAKRAIAALTTVIEPEAGKTVGEIVASLNDGGAKLQDNLTLAELQAAMSRLNVEVVASEDSKPAVAMRDLAINRQYCFKFQGQTICTQIGPQGIVYSTHAPHPQR
jgi:hypothetical protein